MANDFFLEILLCLKAFGSKFLPGLALGFGDRSYLGVRRQQRFNVRFAIYKARSIEQIGRNWWIDLPSTLLISPAPKPVKVRLCLGLVKPGPTGPWRSMGAPVLGRRSLGTVEFDILPDGIELSSYSGLKI